MLIGTVVLGLVVGVITLFAGYKLRYSNRFTGVVFMFAGGLVIILALLLTVQFFL